MVLNKKTMSLGLLNYIKSGDVPKHSKSAFTAGGGLYA
jgi:hypothetical protein